MASRNLKSVTACDERDERVSVTKKTFTRWVNAHLSKAEKPLVEDLFVDFRSGVLLLSLLEIICNKAIKPERGRMRVHHLNNVDRGLSFIQEFYQVRLVNISSNDIVDGNPKLTLSLLSTIIFNFYCHLRRAPGCAEDRNRMENELLTWCQRHTRGYAGINIKNFTTSWRDGLGFLAILHSFRPDLFDFEARARKTSVQNLSLAFHLAMQEYKVERLLDPEDVCESPDKASLVTYLLSLRQGLPSSREESPAGTPTMEADKEDSKPESCQTVSGSSTESMDVLTYQEHVENALVWLIEAEEGLQALSADPSMTESEGAAKEEENTDPDALRSLFEKQEELMQYLWSKQSQLACTLREGHQLLMSGRLTEAENEEVRMQVQMLNQRWDEIRERGLKRQRHTQARLLRLQDSRMTQLDAFLSDLEKQQSEVVGPDIEAIKRQLDEHSAVEKSVESQDPLLSRLQELVIVIEQPEGAREPEPDLEARLDSLASRWSTMVGWLQRRYELLQAALLEWRRFEELESEFADWVESKTLVLDNLCGQETKAEMEGLSKTISGEMKIYEALASLGEAVVRACGENAETKAVIEARIVEHRQRSQALMTTLKEKMEPYAKSPRKGLSRTVSDGTTTDGAAERADAAGGGASKKPRLMEVFNREEFEAQIDELIKWFDSTESTLELINLDSPDPEQKLQVEQQKLLLLDVASSMTEWRVTASQIKELGGVYRDELIADGDSPEEIDVLLSEIDDRMNDIETLLCDTERRLNLSHASHAFYNELSALQRQLEEYVAWLDKEEEGDDYVEAVTQQMRSMKSLDERIKTLSNRMAEFQCQDWPELTHQVEEDFSAFNSRWLQVFDRYMARFEEAKAAAENRQRSSEVSALHAWLDNVDRVLTEEPLSIGAAGLGHIGELSQHYKALADELGDHKNNLSRLESEFSARPAPESMQSVRSRWQEVSGRLMDRVSLLDQAYDALQQFETQLAGMRTWLDDMEEYLRSVESAVLDSRDVTEAQLLESDGALEDMATLEPTMQTLRTAVHPSDPEEQTVLFSMASKELRAQMASDLASLDEQWHRVQDGTREHRDRLRRDLDSHDAAPEAMEEGESALAEEGARGEPAAESGQTGEKAEESEEEAALCENNDGAITSSGDEDAGSSLDEGEYELSSAKIETPTECRRSAFEWCQRVEGQLDVFGNIDGEHTLEEFGRTLEAIQGEYERWRQREDLSEDEQDRLERVNLRLERDRERYRASRYHWEDFQALLQEEDEWIDTVNQSAKESLTRSYVDAEDISEDLDSFEKLSFDHSDENFLRLHDLKNSLSEANILAKTVHSTFNTYNEKFASAKSLLCARLSSLQTSLETVQTANQGMRELETWLEEVVPILRSRLHADLVGEDVPEEFATLKRDFQRNENFVADTQKKIEEHRKAENEEAAARLEVPLKPLVERLENAQTLFRRFQRPAAFDPKFQRVKREVENIADHIHFLDIISIEPEDIENSLDHCTKFEQTLVDVRDDLQLVLTMGKDIAEKRQVDFPERFASQLEHLRKQFEELKTQITDSRDKLRRGLELARKLSVDLSELESCLDTVCEVEGYAQEAACLDEKQAFLEKMLAMLSGEGAVCDSVRAAVSALTPLAEDMEMVHERFEEIMAVVQRRNASLELSEERLKALKEELANAEREMDNFAAELATIMVEAVESHRQEARDDDEEECQRLCTKLEIWRQRLNEIRAAATDSPLAPSNVHRVRLEEKADATKEVLSNFMDKLTRAVSTLSVSSEASAASSSTASSVAAALWGTEADVPGGGSLACLRGEMEALVHSFALLRDSLSAEKAASDLRSQMELVMAMVHVYFRGQLAFYQSQLEDLGASEGENATAYLLLKNFWEKERKRIVQAISEMETLMPQLDELASLIQQIEAHMASRPARWEQAVCERAEQLLDSIREVHSGLELSADRSSVERYRTRTHCRAGSAGAMEEAARAAVSKVNIRMADPRKGGALEALKELIASITALLNTAKVNLDFCLDPQRSRENDGGREEAVEAIEMAQERLAKAQAELGSADEQLQSVNLLLSNTELFNMSALLEAQRKRLTTYSELLGKAKDKWMETAQQWQQFVTEVDDCRNCVARLESDAGEEKAFDPSAETPSDLIELQKRLRQLESASRALVVSCADVEAEFVKKELAELKERCDLLEQRRIIGPVANETAPPPATVNGVSTTAMPPTEAPDSPEVKPTKLPADIIAVAEPLHAPPEKDLTTEYVAKIDEMLSWIHGVSKGIVMPKGFDKVDDCRRFHDNVLGIEQTLSSRMEAIQVLSETGDRFLQQPNLSEEALILVQDKSDVLTQAWNSLLLEVAEKQLLLGNVIRASQEVLHLSERLHEHLNSHREASANSPQILTTIETAESDWRSLEESRIELERHCEEGQLGPPREVLEAVIAGERALQALKDRRKVRSPPPASSSASASPKSRASPAAEVIEAKRVALAASSPKRRLAGDGQGGESPTSSSSGSAAPLSSPYTRRLLLDCDRLAHWLAGVEQYLDSHIITVGDIFDHDEETLRLNHAASSQIHLHADMMLLAVKNYLNEMMTKETNLQRLEDEASLAGMEQAGGQLSERVAFLRRQWSQTGDRLHSRLAVVERMGEETKRLEAARCRLEEWINRIETKLDSVDSLPNRNPEFRSRQLQSLRSDSPTGRALLEEYQAHVDRVVEEFAQEDVSRVKLQANQLQIRHTALMAKIAEKTRKTSSTISVTSSVSPASSPSSVSMNFTPEHQHQQLEAVLRELDVKVGRMELFLDSLQREISDAEGERLTSAKHKLSDVQAEIDGFHVDFETAGRLRRAGPSQGSSLIDQQWADITARWRKLKDKANELKTCVDSNADTWRQFMRTLRSLNDWLTRKDADLIATQSDIGGDVASIQRQYDSHRGFMAEIASRREGLERALERGELYMAQHPQGAAGDQRRRVSESDGDSDSALSESSIGMAEEERARRISRRIRRNVHCLKKKWLELNIRVRDYQEKLNTVLENLRAFESSLTEVDNSLSEAEAAVGSWPPVSHIPPAALSREIEKVEMFRDSRRPIEVRLETLNRQADQLQRINVVLSHTLVTRLEEFRSRYQNLQAEVRRRIMQLCESRELMNASVAAVKTPAASTSSALSGPSREPVASVVATPVSGKASSVMVGPEMDLLQSSVERPWERCLHPSGSYVPYYKNHASQDTQWDHPVMSELLKALQELNNIRFSAYRTAMKLRSLQKELCLDLINLAVAAKAFSQHGLQDVSFERLVDVGQIVACLTSMYRVVSGDAPQKPPPGLLAAARQRQMSVPRCVDLVLNWLLNVYDSVRNGRIRVLSFKVAITLLCAAHLEDKYRYLFTVIADREGRVDQRRLGMLLHDCIQIPRQLGEVASFGGSNIEPSVRSCFQKMADMEHHQPLKRLSLRRKRHDNSLPLPSPARDQSSIKLSHFLAWMRLEPQSIVWMPVIHRLEASDRATHHAKCGACKQHPIRGLRYRCLRCFNYDLCQTCFFNGKVSKSHKINHPMQEYCANTTSGENLRDLSRIFRNRFRSKRHSKRQTKLGYLPVQSVQEGASVESPATTPSHSFGQPASMTQDGAMSASAAAIQPAPHPVLPPSHTPTSQAPAPPPSSLATGSPGPRSSGSRRAASAESSPKRLVETPSQPEDEHQLIAQFCRALRHTRRHQTLPNKLQGRAGSGDVEVPSSLQTSGLERHAAISRSSAELDGVIRSLEEENRALQFEFERLRTGTTPGHLFSGLSPLMGGTLQPAHLMPQAPAPLEPHFGTLPGPAPPPPVPAHLGRPGSPRMEEMVTEARLLRQHKGRLEARMQVLEDHNRQLETQLSRLRLLLQQQQATSGLSSHHPHPLLHPPHPHLHPPGVGHVTSSSSTSEAELYTSMQYASTRRHHSLHRYGASGPPPVPRHHRAASETAGSLSEGEMDDILLGGPRLRHLEMADSCPTVPYAVNRSASSSLGSLFHMAGQVGRAVGQLVTVMTDEFAGDPALASHEAPPSSPLLNHTQPPTASATSSASRTGPTPPTTTSSDA